jgi:hypothetical protein
VLAATHQSDNQVAETLIEIVCRQSEFPEQRVVQTLLTLSEKNQFDPQFAHTEFLEYIDQFESKDALTTLFTQLDSIISTNNHRLVTEIDARISEVSGTPPLGYLYCLKTISAQNPDLVVPLASHLTYSLSSSHPDETNEVAYDILKCLCKERPRDMETVLPELVPFVTNREHPYRSGITELIFDIYPHASEVAKQIFAISYDTTDSKRLNELVGNPTSEQGTQMNQSNSNINIVNKITDGSVEKHATTRQRDNIIKNFVSEVSSQLREARHSATPATDCAEQIERLVDISGYYIVDTEDFEQKREKIKDLQPELQRAEQTNGELSDWLSDQIKRRSQEFERAYHMGTIKSI